jgi:hypothetical protein
MARRRTLLKNGCVLTLDANLDDSMQAEFCRAVVISLPERGT